MAQEIHIKGIVLRTFLSVLERLHGKAVVEATVSKLPPELHDAVVYGRIVPSGWYPVAWQRELHAAAQKVTGRSIELSRLLGKEGAIQDFRSVYKFVTALVSPETLLKQAPRVFSNYYDGGSLEIVESGKNFVRARCTGCHGLDRNTWIALLGGFDAALMFANAKDVTLVVERGGHDGDSSMEAIARWR